MFIVGLGFIVIGGVVIYVIWAGNALQKKYFMEGYRILFHEKKLEISSPFPMRGTPDIVFEHVESGELLTGELKVRSIRKVYPSDQVQISASRMLIAGNYPNKKVSDKGVMLIHTDGVTHTLDVQTLSAKEMNSLYDRFIALVRGKLKPRGADNPHYCEDCPFFKECKVKSC